MADGKVNTYGDRRNSSANVQEPQQLTGIDSNRNPTDDNRPQGNVLMPFLKKWINIDNIMNLAMLAHDMYQTTKNMIEFFKDYDGDTDAYLKDKTEENTEEEIEG